MVLQNIEQAPIEPFVVQQEDVDLFDCLDDLNTLVSSTLTVTSKSMSSSSTSTVRPPRAPRKFRDNTHHMISSCTTLPEDSVDLDDSDRVVITGSASGSEDSYHSRSSRRSRRRSSICSSTSSNSSVCSKSFGFNDGDESIVSCEDSVSHHDRDRDHLEDSPSDSRSSRRRHHKRSTKVGKGKKLSVPIRHVTFTSTVTVRCIPDLDDYSNEEKSQVWYNEQELLQIKQEAQELIQQAKQKKLPHTADELRGLHMTQKRQRRSVWMMALACVLDEQQRHIRNGVPKDRAAETLAKLYKSFAFSAVQIAQKLGEEDALAAAS